MDGKVTRFAKMRIFCFYANERNQVSVLHKRFRRVTYEYEPQNIRLSVIN